MRRSGYRDFIPTPEKRRYAGPTPEAHALEILKRDRPQELFGGWKTLLDRPFKGITSSGAIQDNLFQLRHEDSPIPEITRAADTLLKILSPEQRRLTLHPLDSGLRRHWQNTELFVEKHGLRLEYVHPELRQAVLSLLKKSLSDSGYKKTLATMRLNRFLGELVEAPQILNEWSYNFVIFGTPSLTEPWSWQLFGHHLAIDCLLLKNQMVLTPCFFGAEPTSADIGPFSGTSLFEDEERLGLSFMNALSPEFRETALVSGSLKANDHPKGRWHFADHLMLGGAAQDNRIVPYEGLTAEKLSSPLRQQLLDLIKCYLEPLPQGPLDAKMNDVENHISDLHFCWIGGTEDNKPFYYRIQSPVLLIEFDHHSGVFLNNSEPAPFHVHTIVRTPNGNDYGMDLLRLHYEQSEHHQKK